MRLGVSAVVALCVMLAGACKRATPNVPPPQPAQTAPVTSAPTTSAPVASTAEPSESASQPAAASTSLLVECEDGVCSGDRVCLDGLCMGKITAGITESPPEPREFLAAIEARVWAALEPGPDGVVRCPGAKGTELVDTGMTPPATVRCASGPDGKCAPGVKQPGGYPAQLWTHSAWAALGVHIDVPHRFHYRFSAGPCPGKGSCAFTSQAFGDLDDDGVWSTFERSGMRDATGPNAAAGLYLDPLRMFE